MKKINLLFFFRVISSLKILGLILLLTSNFLYGHNHYLETDPAENPDESTRSPNSKENNELDETTKKLRDNLISAGFIHSVGSSGPNQSIYRSTHNSRLVNKVFEAECSEEYKKFDEDMESFIQSINNPQASSNQTLRIEGALTSCINKIFKEYKKLNNLFTRPINKLYNNKFSHQTTCLLNTLDSSFITDNIKETSNSSKNFKEIKKYINNFLKLTDHCIKPENGIVSLQKNFNPQLCGLRRLYSFNQTEHAKLKTFFETQVPTDEGSKSCHVLRDELIKFTEDSAFKKFIALAKTDCSSIQSLKHSSNDDCSTLAKQLNPPYPEKNPDNLFNECSSAIDTAYKQCFGEEGQQTESQLVLSLINQKSPAVCEQNRLAKAQQAKQDCVQAINQCMDDCADKIESFKEKFLQCFFLPDFNPNSYRAIHKHSNCQQRIKDLKDAFQEQAGKAPFEVVNPTLESLNHSTDSNSSTAFHIKDTCSDPLEKTQFAKKLTEMQKECQQNPQQQNSQEHNQLVDPVTASHTSSGSSARHSTSSSSSGGVKNAPFSYENNNPFNYNSHSQTEDNQNPNSSFQILPPDSSPHNSRSDNNKGSVSADFENTKDSATDPNSSYKNSSSSPPSRRGISSQGYSSSNENPSLAETNTEKETDQTLSNKIHKGIRQFLTSDEQYGAIDERYPQSATSQFLDWLGDKKRQAKKQALKAYDGIAGISREEFQRRLQLNNEGVDLFELQKELFIEACKTHNCEGSGASSEVQAQINQQGRQPSSQ
ncbi:MAG: hypothetical protein OXN83_05235 [Oligoflexia bacterium]|nr:hypothetical protein [Oligoflexia bacterium]